MSLDRSESEDLLFECLGRQSEHYARSLELLRTLPDRFAGGAETHDVLHDIHAELGQVARLETEAAEAKAEWQNRRAAPSPRLQQRMLDVQCLLEELLAEIAVAEEHAQTARQRLRPHVESEVQGARMRSAYERFSAVR